MTATSPSEDFCDELFKLKIERVLKKPEIQLRFPSLYKSSRKAPFFDKNTVNLVSDDPEMLRLCFSQLNDVENVAVIGALVKKMPSFEGHCDWKKFSSFDIRHELFVRCWNKLAHLCQGFANGDEKTLRLVSNRSALVHELTLIVHGLDHSRDDWAINISLVWRFVKPILRMLNCKTQQDETGKIGRAHV